MRAIAMIGAVAAALAAGGAGPAPVWMKLGACAGAYRANAAIADPQRPAAMTAQIRDVADDYEKAAMKRLRADPKNSRKAAEVLRNYVAQQQKSFAAQPRAAVEEYIEACPQPDDE